MEMSIEPPCETEKESNEEKDRESSAVLVKGRYIADGDGLGTGGFHLDSISVDDLFLAPTRVPFLKIDRIRRRA